MEFIENLLVTFVLLNEGAPDVNIIYFVLIERKKEKIVNRNYQAC